MRSRHLLKLFLVLTLVLISSTFVGKVLAATDVTDELKNTSTQNIDQTTCVNPIVYTPLVKIPGVGDQNNDGKITICPTSLATFLKTIFNYVIGLALMLAFIAIVYGGVKYATSDAIMGKSEGKKVITDAFLGLALALGAWLILYTIDPNLLSFDLNIGSTQYLNNQGGKGTVQELPSGTGGNPSLLSQTNSEGRATNCGQGLVSISGVGSKYSGKQICPGLLQKLQQLKTLTPNTSWVVTDTIGPGHSSACHSSGNSNSGSCADIAISGKGTWGEICAGLSKISGVGVLNEASRDSSCTQYFKYKTYPTTTGANIHINYTGN